MSAILRASGPDFDTDAFLTTSIWQDVVKHRRGEPVFPSKPDGRKREKSGINVVVSDADFYEFKEQINDAIKFLEGCSDEVIRLVRFPGVTGAVLDFGVAWLDTYTQSDWLPAELVRLAGACGIAIEISHYPISEEKSVT